MGNYRTNFRRLGLTLLLLAIASRAHGDEIDDYVRTQATWMRIPGLSLAVVKDGKIVKAKGYGLANVETKTPVMPETVFKIGSVSKQFLAAAIMILVQEKRISLDDSVRKYLESAPEAWNGISIRHLLTHTSGIIREAPGFDPYKEQLDADVIRSVYPEPLRFVPGEKWEYSNIGYYCLAEIIAKVSGMPWSEFLRARIFAPQGMTATRTATADIVPGRASGYETRGKLQNAESWLAVRPSGGILSTVLDFARWDAALTSDSMLSDDSRRTMWTPVTLADGSTHAYGFGWFVDTVEGHTRVSHSGGVPGFVCEFHRYVDDKLSVVVMANVGSRDLGDMTAKIASFYVPALRPPDAEPALPDREPDVTARIRRVISDLAQGKVDASLFAPELAAGLADDVRSGFSDILRQLGPIRSLSPIERRQDGSERVYRYLLKYQHLVLFVDCTFDKDDRFLRFAVRD